MKDLFTLLGGHGQEVFQPAVALTIAGSDSGGGAGIQADLKTFAASKVFGTSVLTLVTAQNTQGVTAVEMLPDSVIRAQFEAVMSDLNPTAAKTGALGNDRVIGLVAEMLDERPIEKLVVDPVMVSKHGDPLMPEQAVKAFIAHMVPRALIITPNRFEARALIGRDVDDVRDMQEAAKRIFDMGAPAVLIKGGHLDHIVRDILYDGNGFTEFGADRIRSPRVHGSGCTFSAAITAKLAEGATVEAALEYARDFITKAILMAPEIGEGISPVNPMHSVWNA